MAELKVQMENVVKAYNNAPKEAQKILCDIFGRNTLEPFDYDELDENEKEVLAAYSRLRRKAKEKFPNWKPDFTNKNQYKYYPWFDYNAGVGFVVDYTGYVSAYCGGTATGVGSRLCFPTRNDAIEFANENIEDYNIILTK